MIATAADIGLGDIAAEDRALAPTRSVSKVERSSRSWRCAGNASATSRTAHWDGAGRSEDPGRDPASVTDPADVAIKRTRIEDPAESSGGATWFGVIDITAPSPYATDLACAPTNVPPLLVHQLPPESPMPSRDIEHDVAAVRVGLT